MASSVTKQACVQCDKGGGIAMCNGCQQSFCIKHFLEHRQELSIQIENIGQEHDLLRRDMDCDQYIQSLLERIHRWEQESINIIQENARKARIDLQNLFEQNKKEMKTSVDQLTKELRRCTEADDYTETDLRRWREQLEELRQTVSDTSMINIDYDHNMRAALSLIRISISPQHQQRQQLSSFVQRIYARETNHLIVDQLTDFDNEKFLDIHGNIVLSLDRSTACCSESRWDGLCVSGLRRYSSEQHRIRFRIDKKNSVNLFFGILTASQPLIARITEVESAYGWLELDFPLMNGKAETKGWNKIINTGDEVSLILDCDHRRIRFHHHRTNMLVDLPVDLRLCPFPWKIVVRLDTLGDTVRIL
ncbi:unnamed protein product [Adineta ricciae]|uniref:B box-type domain-containing protein n=1 Tax=Adineta ricciae TaxID=249248 RepID=A0A816GU33_ADIRI|nr:unnamed protein product [Adineta ricciae]